MPKNRALAANKKGKLTFADKQSDWPGQTFQPGYVFFDYDGASEEINAMVEDFLTSDDSPTIFALESTAVHNPGRFFQESAEAAKRLRRRALLIGSSPMPQSKSPQLLSVPYAPYSRVFLRATAIVHQGGFRHYRSGNRESALFLASSNGL